MFPYLVLYVSKEELILTISIDSSKVASITSSSSSFEYEHVEYNIYPFKAQSLIAFFRSCFCISEHFITLS